MSGKRSWRLRRALWLHHHARWVLRITPGERVVIPILLCILLVSVLGLVL